MDHNTTKTQCKQSLPFLVLGLMMIAAQALGCAAGSKTRMETPKENPAVADKGAPVEEKSGAVSSQPQAPKEIPAEESSIGKTPAKENPLKEAPVDESAAIEERWGVKVLGIRMTANAYLLDFRFEVVDPEKAQPLTARAVKAFLIDEATGNRMNVPNMPKVGTLRSKGKAEAGRSYFILFGNPKGLLRKGSKVTVGIDDFKVEHLAVQ